MKPATTTLQKFKSGRNYFSGVFIVLRPELFNHQVFDDRRAATNFPISVIRHFRFDLSQNGGIL